VTVQSEAAALSMAARPFMLTAFWTLNDKFTAPAKLAAGETLVVWSCFVSEREVRFDPAVDRSMNPVPGTDLFRLTR
jgi:hypothetical protein